MRNLLISLKMHKGVCTLRNTYHYKMRKILGETRVYKISSLVNVGLREAEDEAVGINTDFSNSACSMSGRIGLVFCFFFNFEIL